MSKKKSPRSPSHTTPSSAEAKLTDPAPADAAASLLPPGRLWLLVMFVVIVFGSAGLYAVLQQSPPIREFQYRVVAEYKHDESSFTQGLVYRNGTLFESTGQYGESKIRHVDLKTGQVIKSRDLDPKLFGEGLAAVGDELFQITYREHVGIVYDLDLNELRRFKYSGEGWGLTYDGSHLILSDGTAVLRFFDPKTMEEVGRLNVRKGRFGLPRINELEYIDGMIYANVWHEDIIYQISPTDGSVTGQVDLSDLYPRSQRDSEAVLNGIAFNSDTGNLIVTGKYWPKVFEIRLGAVKER